jgi:hypothetical protein
VPPVIGSSIQQSQLAPPPLLVESGGKRSGARQFLAVLLTLCLGIFLADGFVSFADKSLVLFLNHHALVGVRAVTLFLTIILGLATYGAMGLTTSIPKRLFLPVTLFNPAAGLLLIVLAIYFYDRMALIRWIVSLCEVALGVAILAVLQGGLKLRWPLVRQAQLQPGRFSWLNLSVFGLMNLFVLLPGTIAYLIVCGSLALNHFTQGFVSLRPSGLTVQARNYVRNDGKRIELFPMAHIGDADFYRRVSESFPTNSVVLTEGVSDSQNLLTNRLTYKRPAKSLGLTEQQREFRPARGKLVRADVDIAEFNTNTIAFLNLMTPFYSKGITVELLTKLMNYVPPPDFEKQLWDDILTKRNQHLLKIIESRLTLSDTIVVPWGAAHMPGLAKQIEKMGFHQEESRDYVVIRFGPRPKVNPAAGKDSFPHQTN